MGERGLQRPDKGHKVDIRAECLKGFALALLDTAKLGRGMNCNEWVGETNTEAEPAFILPKHTRNPIPTQEGPLTQL